MSKVILVELRSIKGDLVKTARVETVGDMLPTMVRHGATVYEKRLGDNIYVEIGFAWAIDDRDIVDVKKC